MVDLAIKVKRSKATLQLEEKVTSEDRRTFAWRGGQSLGTRLRKPQRLCRGPALASRAQCDGMVTPTSTVASSTRHAISWGCNKYISQYMVQGREQLRPHRQIAAIIKHLIVCCDLLLLLSGGPASS